MDIECCCYGNGNNHRSYINSVPMELGFHIAKDWVLQLHFVYWGLLSAGCANWLSIQNRQMAATGEHDTRWLMLEPLFSPHTQTRVKDSSVDIATGNGPSVHSQRLVVVLCNRPHSMLISCWLSRTWMCFIAEEARLLRCNLPGTDCIELIEIFMGILTAAFGLIWYQSSAYEVSHGKHWLAKLSESYHCVLRDIQEWTWSLLLSWLHAIGQLVWEFSLDIKL